MSEPRKQLHKGLVDENLYTKSYEDFTQQFSDEEARGELWQGLKGENLYTKSYEEFSKQFFSDIQKKNQVGSPTVSEESPTGLPQQPAPIAEESSKLTFLGREPVEKERNPFKTGLKMMYSTLAHDMPSAMGGALAAGTSGAIPSFGPGGVQPLGVEQTLSEAYGEDWRVDMSEHVPEMAKDVLRWSLNKTRNGAEYKKNLITSWDDVKRGDALDFLNFVSASVGQAAAQIPATALTGGISGVGQAVGNIYVDELSKLAQEYNISEEEVMDRGLDDRASAVAFGFASGALEKLGADAVMGKLTKGLLDKALRGRTRTLLGGVARVTGASLTEGATEAAQEAIEELGASIGSGTDFNLTYKEARDAALMGAFGGGGISTATTITDYLTTKKKEDGKDEKQETPGSEQATVEEVHGKEQPEPQVQRREEGIAEVSEEEVTQDTPRPELSLGEVVELQKQVEESKKVDLGTTVEHEGKQQQVIDEQRDEEELQSITLRDEEGNETEVGYDTYLQQQNERLQGVPEEQLNLARAVAQEEEKSDLPEGVSLLGATEDAEGDAISKIRDVAKRNPDRIINSPRIANLTKDVRLGLRDKFINERKKIYDQHIPTLESDRKGYMKGLSKRNKSLYKLERKIFADTEDAVSKAIYEAYELAMKSGDDPDLVKEVDALLGRTSKRYDETDIDQINDLGIDNLKPIVNAFKAIPDVKGVTIHKDDNSFSEATGGVAAGAYVSGEVHINAQRVNSTTGLHEAVTPIAAKVATSNPELLNNFYNQIKDSKEYEQLKEFEVQYPDDVKKEEVLTEYLARVASGEIDTSPSTIEKVKSFIQNILDKAGLKLFDINLEDETDVRYFAGQLAENLRSGKPVVEGQTDVTRFQNPVNPDLVKAKNVLRQGWERGFINSTNKKQQLQAISQHFNLPLPSVENVMRHIEQGPRHVKLPSKIETNKFYKQAKGFHSKWLSGKKGMPKKVQQMVETLNGSVTAQVDASMNLAKRVNKLAGKKWIDDVNELLRGQTTPSASPLPQKTKDLVIKMRASVDNLTQTILDEGYVEEMVLGTTTTAGVEADIARLEGLINGLQGMNDPKSNQRRGLYEKRKAEKEAKLRSVENMRQVLQDNMGSYMVRAYEVYNNKNYKPSQAVMDNAVQYIMQAEGLSREAAERSVREKLQEYKNDLEDRTGGETKSRTGRKDYSSMLERKEIPPELRELMGEYDDPIQAFGITMHRLASFIENARFLNNMKEIGMGYFIFEKGDLAAPPPERLVKISAKNNKNLTPLDGLYTYKEIYDELKGRNNVARVNGVIDWANAIVNWNKTVGSYQTHARNVIGNIPFMLGNGYFLSVDPRTWGKPTQAVVEAFKAVGRDAPGKFGSEAMDTEIDNLLTLLKSNGLIGQDLATNLVKDIIGQKDIPAELYKRRYNRTRNVFSKGWSTTKKGVEVLNTLYGAEDDFFKVAAYLIERDQRSDAYYGKKYDQLTEEQQAEVNEEVIEIVKNVLPNYNRLGRSITMLSTFPLVGNFVPFMTESLRVTANTAGQAVAELRSDNPKIRTIGARRLVNQIVYAYAKAAIIKGISAGSGFAINAFTGWWDDDDEKERERAVREYLPPWVSFNDVAILSHEGPVIKLQDISATDPHGNIARVKNAIRMSDSPAEIPSIIWEELGEPFFDTKILFDWLASVREGKDNYGRQITRDTAPIEESIASWAEYAARTVGPSSYNSAMKVYEGKSDLASQFLGNQYEINVEDGFYFKLKEFSNVTGGGAAKEGIKRELNNVWNSDSPIEKKEKKTEQLNKEYARSLNRLKDQYQKATLIGADPVELYNTMKKGGTSKVERNYVAGYTDMPPTLTQYDAKIYNK